jgi:hypothetical protein
MKIKIDGEAVTDAALLAELEAVIEKHKPKRPGLVFEPEEGEPFYYLHPGGHIDRQEWDEDCVDLLKQGNVFRTREDVEAVRDLRAQWAKHGIELAVARIWADARERGGLVNKVKGFVMSRIFGDVLRDVNKVFPAFLERQRCLDHDNACREEYQAIYGLDEELEI